MKISLDFDGVISDTINSWVDKYNNIYAYDLQTDFITSRDIDKWGFYEKLNISQDTCFDIFSMAWGDWMNLKPMEPHLKQKTKMLNNLAPVDIVTAVQPEHLEDIEKWLKYHNITYNNLVHSTAKHELDYDIYIDDAVKNIQAVFDAGKHGLLLNQPWNVDMRDQQKPVMISNTKYKIQGSITRVYNLYHAIDVVRDIVNDKQ